jgi:hypothetical protein
VSDAAAAAHSSRVASTYLLLLLFTSGVEPEEGFRRTRSSEKRNSLALRNRDSVLVGCVTTTSRWGHWGASGALSRLESRSNESRFSSSRLYGWGESSMTHHHVDDSLFFLTLCFRPAWLPGSLAGASELTALLSSELRSSFN